jgi:hypothetical protein
MKTSACFAVFVALLLPLLAGCSGKKLTQEEAMSILLKNPPGKMARSINRDEPVETIDPAVKERLEKLEAAGLVSISTVPGDASRKRGPRYLITPTSKLIPFVVREDPGSLTIKFGDIVIDRITGIRQKGDEADVTYTTRLVLTPVGEVFAPLSNPSPGPNHASMRRVDGRWT